MCGVYAAIAVFSKYCEIFEYHSSKGHPVNRLVLNEMDWPSGGGGGLDCKVKTVWNDHL